MSQQCKSINVPFPLQGLIQRSIKFKVWKLEICNIEFFRSQSRRSASATLQEVGESAASTKKKEELEEHYALADFTAEDASQVSFKRGDTVFVKTKDESGRHIKIVMLQNT